MVKRPLKDRRPLGPFISRSSSDSEDFVDIEDPKFDSIEDLPDSPMLKEYVNRQAEYLGKDVEDIINSKPVKDYMKRLGVWDRAVDGVK